MRWRPVIRRWRMLGYGFSGGTVLCQWQQRGCGSEGRKWREMQIQVGNLEGGLHSLALGLLGLVGLLCTGNRVATDTMTGYMRHVVCLQLVHFVLTRRYCRM